MTDRILIIEDDPDLARLITLHLDDLGFTAEVCRDGNRGLERARSRKFLLIILDLGLPGLDGLEVCKLLRRQGSQTPILMLTARSSEIDRVLGLELGADDYLTKPFSIKELLARVKAILRRTRGGDAAGGGAGRIALTGLDIDPVSREVRLGGSPVDLTAREFDLLFHFASHPGRVFSRRQLLSQVWGYGYEGYEHTVNSHINRLRKKIEPAGAALHYIHTVWGVGYKFQAVGVEPEENS